MGELEEVEQLPGVNSAYRREVLIEVGSFDPGAIGAEDVMMDNRIRMAGYQLWSDGSAVMWHRRRGVKRVRKQIRNYGFVRTLAGSRYPELWGFSHSMVSSFPILVTMSAFPSFGDALTEVFLGLNFGIFPRIQSPWGLKEQWFTSSPL